MELARLVLEYVDRLVWPTLVVCVLLWLRRPLRKVIDRFVREADRFEVEIGGQKLSIRTAERVIDQAITAAAHATKAGSDFLPQVRADSRRLLHLLVKLDADDIASFRTLPVPYGSAEHASRAGSIEKLLNLGLAVHQDHVLAPTELGRRVSSLVGIQGDPDEALHKITQAM